MLHCDAANVLSELSYSVPSIPLSAAYPWGSRGCNHFILPLSWLNYKVAGSQELIPVITLGKGRVPPGQSPAHHRALTDSRGANCTSELGFNILLKDTSTCSSVPPQGSWVSNQLGAPKGLAVVLLTEIVSNISRQARWREIIFGRQH